MDEMKSPVLVVGGRHFKVTLVWRPARCGARCCAAGGAKMTVKSDGATGKVCMTQPGSM